MQILWLSNQAQVDEGAPLKICLSQFCKWIHKIQQQKKIIFATGVSDSSTSEVKLCAFVTWSGKKMSYAYQSQMDSTTTM
jgi:hypothetical protein